MKILHIEDENDLAALVKQLLGESVQITHASNGYEGVELAQSGGFDVIISDVALGGSMTGFDVLRELKELGVTTPVIANSSNYDSNKTMVRFGAKTFLGKLRTSDDLTEETRQRWLQTIKEVL